MNQLVLEKRRYTSLVVQGLISLNKIYLKINVSGNDDVDVFALISIVFTPISTIHRLLKTTSSQHSDQSFTMQFRSCGRAVFVCNDIKPF